MSEIDPLVERVDALLKRHQQQPPAPPSPPALATPPESQLDAASPAGVEALPPEPPALPAAGPDDDIPVLTEVIDLAPNVDPAIDVVALTEDIESAVREKVLAEVDQLLQQRLNRSIGDLVDQAIDGLRADLTVTVRQTVRDALEKTLAEDATQRARKS